LLDNGNTVTFLLSVTTRAVGVHVMLVQIAVF
jgi:hypothetical protein